MAKIFYLQVVFVVITVMVSGQGDVPRRCDYGDHCGFVPAPPGRTPSCAAPGLTYCEQLDHYPKDLIRELVDKKQFDLSSLLSDETREDFGATRNRHGPYGYGPNSLRGTQHISLVNPQPHGLGGQGVPSVPSFPNTGFLPPDNDPFLNRGQIQNQYFRGNSLPPPNGYVGYYTPSDQQRPPSQSFFPPHNSYLPSKTPNVSLEAGWNQAHFRPTFPSAINLDQYDDFWRGNPYFEVPKSFHDFHRNTIGQNGEYIDNNAGRYYSMGRSQAGPYPAAHRGSGPIHEKDPNPGAAHSTNHRRSTQQSSVTIRHDWIQTFPHNRRPDAKAADDNGFQSKTLTKRNHETNLENIFKLLSDYKEDDKHLGTNHTTLSRSKRQTAGREQLCPTRSQYITPRAALNKQGNWMYVVNMGDTAGNSQLVKTEVCVSQECNGICSLPLGYNSRCEQRFVQKRLVALEQNGQRLYTDIFWFPSCCLCTISNNQT